MMKTSAIRYDLLRMLIPMLLLLAEVEAFSSRMQKQANDRFSNFGQEMEAMVAAQAQAKTTTTPTTQTTQPPDVVNSETTEQQATPPPRQANVPYQSQARTPEELKKQTRDRFENFGQGIQTVLAEQQRAQAGDQGSAVSPHPDDVHPDDLQQQQNDAAAAAAVASQSDEERAQALAARQAKAAAAYNAARTPEGMKKQALSRFNDFGQNIAAMLEEQAQAKQEATMQPPPTEESSQPPNAAVAVNDEVRARAQSIPHPDKAIIPQGPPATSEDLKKQALDRFENFGQGIATMVSQQAQGTHDSSWQNHPDDLQQQSSSSTPDSEAKAQAQARANDDFRRQMRAKITGQPQGATPELKVPAPQANEQNQTEDSQQQQQQLSTANDSETTPNERSSQGQQARANDDAQQQERNQGQATPQVKVAPQQAAAATSDDLKKQAMSRFGSFEQGVQTMLADQTQAAQESTANDSFRREMQAKLGRESQATYPQENVAQQAKLQQHPDDLLQNDSTAANDPEAPQSEEVKAQALAARQAKAAAAYNAARTPEGMKKQALSRFNDFGQNIATMLEDQAQAKQEAKMPKQTEGSQPKAAASDSIQSEDARAQARSIPHPDKATTQPAATSEDLKKQALDRFENFGQGIATMVSQQAQGTQNSSWQNHPDDLQQQSSSTTTPDSEAKAQAQARANDDFRRQMQAKITGQPQGATPELKVPEKSQAAAAPQAKEQKQTEDSQQQQQLSTANDSETTPNEGSSQGQQARVNDDNAQQKTQTSVTNQGQTSLQETVPQQAAAATSDDLKKQAMSRFGSFEQGVQTMLADQTQAAQESTANDSFRREMQAKLGRESQATYLQENVAQQPDPQAKLQQHPDDLQQSDSTAANDPEAPQSEEVKAQALAARQAKAAAAYNAARTPEGMKKQALSRFNDFGQGIATMLEDQAQAKQEAKMPKQTEESQSHFSAANDSETTQNEEAQAHATPQVKVTQQQAPATSDDLKKQAMSRFGSFEQGVQTMLADQTQAAQESAANDSFRREMQAKLGGEYQATPQAKVAEQAQLTLQEMQKQTEDLQQNSSPTEAEAITSKAEQEKKEAEAIASKAEQEKKEAEAIASKAEREKEEIEAITSKAEQEKKEAEAISSKAEQEREEAEAITSQAKQENEEIINNFQAQEQSLKREIEMLAAMVAKKEEAVRANYNMSQQILDKHVEFDNRISTPIKRDYTGDSRETELRAQQGGGWFGQPQLEQEFARLAKIRASNADANWEVPITPELDAYGQKVGKPEPGAETLRGEMTKVHEERIEIDGELMSVKKKCEDSRHQWEQMMMLELAARDKEVAKQKTETETLLAETTKIKKERVEIDEELISLRLKHDEHHDWNQTMQSELDARDQEVAEQKPETEKLLAEMAKMYVERIEIDKELTLLKSKYEIDHDQWKQTMQSELDARDQELAEQKPKMEKLHAEIAKMRAERTEIDGDLTSLKSMYESDHNQWKQTMQSELDAHAQEVAEQKPEMENLNAEIAKMRAERTEIDGDLTSLQSKYEIDHDQWKETMHRELDARDTEMAEQKAENEKLRTEITKIRELAARDKVAAEKKKTGGDVTSALDKIRQKMGVKAKRSNLIKSNKPKDTDKKKSK